MFARTLIGAILVLSASQFAPAAADDDVVAPDHGLDAPVTSLIIENDLFGGTDRNYTNGLRIERISRKSQAHPWLRQAAGLLPFIDIKQDELRQGFGFAHAIYTPRDIELRDPDPTDRPYAGWMYVSGRAVAVNAAHTQQHSVQLNIGVVGPSALGRFVQDEWHALIDEKQPQGWDAQIDDMIGVELIAERMHLIPQQTLIGPLNFDGGVFGGATIGNVHLHANVGLMARIGFDLDADFGPPRIRPAISGAGVFDPTQDFGGYVFAAVEGRAVGHNTFLDGSFFRADDPHVTGRRTFVGDLQVGAAVNLKRIQLAFTYVHRTEQFVAQAGPDRFGAISISAAY